MKMKETVSPETALHSSVPVRTRFSHDIFYLFRSLTSLWQLIGFSVLPKGFMDEEVLTDASMEISAEYVYPLAWHCI